MNNKKQIGMIAIILVAVIALSVGFAAFSSTLNIESQASVNPNAADFSVKFSKQENILDESNVIATSVVGEDVEAREAKIDNSSNPTITNLNASFTKPGDSVTYEFYVMNTGEYNAYLRDVNFKTNNDKFISCTAGSGATESLVEEACKGINFELTIGDQSYTPNGAFVVQELSKGASKKVTVKISYASGSSLADGPFTVNIGDVALTYASTSAGEYPIPEIGDEIATTDPACFISTTPGEINDYVCDKTNVVIPANLSLPVSTAVDAEFNMDRCTAYFILNMGYSQANALDICTQTKSSFDGMETMEEKAIVEYSFLIDYVYEQSGQNIEIMKIGDNAFLLDNIISLTFESNNIVSIGNSSFSLTDLEGEIVIPNSVMTIGAYAFSHTRSEDNVSLGKINSLIFEGDSEIEIIGESAFYANQIDGELTLPDSVTTIGYSAFRNNQISTLNIGSKITSIGDEAFKMKDTTLETININMTKEEFNGLNITNTWYSGTPTINYK